MSQLGWKDEDNFMDRVFHQRVSSFSIGEEGQRPLVRANILMDEVNELTFVPDVGAFYVDFVVDDIGNFKEWFGVGVIGPFPTVQEAKREAIKVLRCHLHEDVASEETLRIQELEESPLRRFGVFRGAVDRLLIAAVRLRMAAEMLSEFKEEA